MKLNPPMVCVGNLPAASAGSNPQPFTKTPTHCIELKPRVNHFQKHPQPTLKLYRISSQKLTSARKRLAQFKLLQGLLFDKAGSEKVTFGPFTFTFTYTSNST